LCALYIYAHVLRVFSSVYGNNTSDATVKSHYFLNFGNSGNNPLHVEFRVVPLQPPILKTVPVTGRIAY
jgi:hypothetical protein